jgi:hypothetical protein
MRYILCWCTHMWVCVCKVNCKSSFHISYCQDKKTTVVKKQLLVLQSWQCTSSCVATDMRHFGQHKHNCASSATLLAWPGSGRLFFYFPNWNPLCKDGDFRRVKKLQKTQRKAYQDCFQKWQQHWDWCNSAGGEYFVGNKAHSVVGMFRKL